MLTIVKLYKDTVSAVSTFNPANITSIDHGDGMRIWQADGKYSRFSINVKNDLDNVDKIAMCLSDTHVVIVYTDSFYAIRCANGKPLSAIVDECKAGFELAE